MIETKLNGPSTNPSVLGLEEIQSAERTAFARKLLLQ